MKRFRLKLSFVFLLFCGSLNCKSIYGQQDGIAGENSTSLPSASQNVPAGNEPRDISVLQLPKNILVDQKGIWTFPTQVARGEHLLPTFAFLGATAGLIAADSHDASYFRSTSTFTGFNRVMNSTATEVEIGLVPASLYLFGWAEKRDFARKSGLLTAEAMADTLVDYSLLNVSTRRLRPMQVPPGGLYLDTFYDNPGHLDTSFPSGHAILSFAAASVIARRYGDHRWVPLLAYAAASAIALSRVTLQEHFPSDVFVGAVLGYSIGRFVVITANCP